MVASQDSSAPLVTVFGATGNQGASVIDHLIASSKPYRIRGVTRDPSKPSGQELKTKGVEAVKANLSNTEEIKQAIQGANYVFVVTNFWESGDEEINQGKGAVDAIKSTTPDAVLLWSGLPAAKKISGGKYVHVKHFDNKAEVYEYAKSSGIKVVSVEPACYQENFVGMMAPRKQEDGSFVYGMPSNNPDSKVSFINVRQDYGAFVVGTIEAGLTEGQVLAATEEFSFPDLAATVAQASGKNVKFYPVPAEQFKAAVGDDLTDMMGYFGDFGYYGRADLSPSQKLVKTDTIKFADFVKKTDWNKILA